MKKIIILSLCAVLIITAMLCGYQPAEYVAGKGKGKNEKVQTTEEFSNVIEGVCASLNAFGTKATPMAAPKSKSNADYTSVTMDIKTTASNKVSGQGVDMYMNMSCSGRYYISSNEEMLLLMAADICLEDYYNSTLTHIVFDADIYLRNGKCAIKYNDFSVNGMSRDYTFLLGQWIDVETFSADFVEYFNTCFEADKMNLMLLNTYINEYGDEAFKEKNNKLVMKDDVLLTYIDESFEISNILGMTLDYQKHDKASMSIDFTNKTSPKWNYKVENGKYSANIPTSETSSSEYTYIFNTDQSVEFSNINNTIIEFDESMIVSFDEIMDM